MIYSTNNIPFKNGFFDFIVYGDILEHLKNPEAALLKLRNYLSRKGFIIISLPNVAHVYNRKNLLFGRWDYNDAGILDRTHLRFFTLKAAKEMIEKAGYEIVDIKASGRFINALKIRRLMPMLAAQFIIMARKK